MPYRFSISRAVQSAGVLLRQEPSQRMSRIRILKLLYMADRVSLKETGSPITGDSVVAMRHGPVLSELYDCIKGTACHLTTWERFFRSEGHDVVMQQVPSTDDLCRYEIETLQKIFAEWRDKDEWEIVEATHAFPEWSDPGQTSKPIAFEDILRAVGWGEEEAKKILQEAASQAGTDRFFEGDP